VSAAASAGKIKRIGADRMRVLKALSRGGAVERRRIYPFEATYHLRDPGAKGPASITSEHAVADLVARGFIMASSPPDLTRADGADSIDYTITPAGQYVVVMKGVPFDDPQIELIGEPELRPQTAMDSAA
jgi:hypothetical protein